MKPITEPGHDQDRRAQNLLPNSAPSRCILKPTDNVSTWTFLFLLCVGSIIYSKKCIWRQDNLKNLQHMIPENEISHECLTNTTLPDTRHLFKTSQVESGAITVCDLFYKVINFYRKHQEKLVNNQTAWELYHQRNQLEGGISSTIEKHLFARKINKYFIKLEKILEEQDDAVCARRIIYVNIKRILLQADRLSKRMFLTKSQ